MRDMLSSVFVGSGPSEIASADCNPCPWPGTTSQSSQSASPAPPLPTCRTDLIARLREPVTYDLAVIGGGATGLGIAVDAAARGLRVVLVESHDFAKGTSSRATKLLHGGVRYLAQGNIGLVREALRERTTLLRNAPHLAQPLSFVMPSYRWWEKPYYGTGLMLYDLLAGAAGLGSTQFLSRARALQLLPTLRPDGLRGGVQYWDGQFDDARLAVALARTAALHGALVVNYCAVRQLLHTQGRVSGLVVEDTETGQQHPVQAGCVVNATGVWVDAVRQLDGDAGQRPVKPMVAPSQGVHLVVDRSFLPTPHALMVPRTADGRVLFAVPWLGKVILGTTDTPRHDLAREPMPFAEEVAFILRESARYLCRPPQPADVLSVWVGLRPLVKPGGEEEGGNEGGTAPSPSGTEGTHRSTTSRLSREHTVRLARSGLVTVTGGKWTTYRAMAEDVLTQCMQAGLLQLRRGGVTLTLRLAGAPAAGNSHGLSDFCGADDLSGHPDSPVSGCGDTAQNPAHSHSISAPPGIHSYGADAATVLALPGANCQLGGHLTEAMVRFAVRHEYARTVEDVLARRSRLLFLDARMAAALAESVASILRDEGVAEPQPEALRTLAQQYLHLPV